MTLESVSELYDYGYWANRRLFAVLEELPDEEFTRPVAGSYGSLRNTLVHMLSAEWGWLDRCGGPARGPRLVADDYPTAVSVIETWTRVEGQMREFLGSLTDAALARDIEFTIGGDRSGTLRLGEMLQHAVVHGVHHRGQLALLLRALGHTPGDVDMFFYYVARRGAA